MSTDSFLFQAFIYLTAAVVSVPLAKRLGLGSVLGYLIAGIVIGPFVLGLIGEEKTDVMHFAEFGVVMMLFLIGLELQPALLWRMRAPILGLGGCQVLITGTLIGGLCFFAAGLDWKMSTAIGMTFALSSTAIVLQSLGEKGLLKTPGGQSSFSVLLFQDIAVIPMLAVMPLLAMSVPEVAEAIQSPADATGQALNEAAGEGHGGGHGEGDDHGHSSGSLIAGLPGYLQAIIVLAGVGGIVFMGRFLVRPVFRIIAAVKLREIFTATALLLVVGIAVAMQAIGLSPALGTFVAGVVLAESEYRHELETDIEPFKGLLLGLFFIAVGASIDFDLLFTQPGLILGLVAGLIVLKFVVLIVLGRVFGMTHSQNLMFSFSLAQGGEFAFVLFSFAAASQVLPDALIAQLMAVVAISMALTPVLMIINDRLVQPLFAARGGELDDDEADTIDEQQSVIIAGFGRFGQIVGRLLRANGIETVVLDHDPAQIELLRKFGQKVFYGEATRMDLLHSAGAETAKLLIVAIEERERAVELVQTVRQHFPHLKILARAYDRRHAYELHEAGAHDVFRETFSSALDMGVQALQAMGFRAHQSHRAAMNFKSLDEKNLRELAPVFRDDASYVLMARRRGEDLERVLRADLEDRGAYRTDHSFESASPHKRAADREAG